jgi:hypothetical protein
MSYANKLQVNAIYSAPSFVLGASGSTGSGLINVTRFKTKTACANIYPSLLGSGSLRVSGSFDGTNMIYVYTGSVFLSGSQGQYTTITDAFPYMQIYLFNEYTGSSISGSLYLTGY